MTEPTPYNQPDNVSFSTPDLTTSESTSSPEIPETENPWTTNFGSVLEPLPSPEDIKSKLDKEERIRQRAEKKEILSEVATLNIKIDKVALAEMDLPPNLEPMRETFLKLPDELDFKPGVTLIFGENGAGKSTLANTFLHAINYQLTYQDLLDEGQSESEAKNTAQQLVLEKPTHRGTSYEEHMDAGIAPQLAHIFKVEKIQSLVRPKLLNIQAEVGRVIESNRQMASAPGHVENYSGAFEMRGNAYSDSDIAKFTADRKSSRQTVDQMVAGGLDYLFQNRRMTAQERHDWKKTEQIGLAHWDKPEFMKSYDLAETQRRADQWGRASSRETMYYPGVMFIDEPESGMSPKRHQQLADEIKKWGPDGSILIMPSNSPILYGSEIPRIDLDTPEKGIFTPQ